MQKNFLLDFLRFIKWYFPYKKSIKSCRIKVLNFEETVNNILVNRLSVTRFGDGELRFMLSEDTGNTFEVNSIRLAKELKNVITLRSNNVMVCLPSVYDNLSGLKFEDKIFWQREVSLHLKEYYNFINTDVTYGDAFFTRPYEGYYIKHENAESKFLLLKKIWNKKNVILVEGELTRFGVGNDLLDNVSELKRVLAPAKNAFEKIDDIYLETKTVIEKIKQSKDNVLVLLSLGPTATVLAAKISQELNVQAIDVGHLDIEYEWFLRRSNVKIPIEGKYVNESSGEKYLQGKIDDKYEKEIVSKIV